MNQDYLDMVRQVLDRPVVDCNEIHCGRVDDLEIDGVKEPKVTAILIGNGAASERMPELARYISQKLFGKKIVRVPWKDVSVVTEKIKLRVHAKDLKLDERTGFAFRMIERLPLAWKK